MSTKKIEPLDIPTPAQAKPTDSVPGGAPVGPLDVPVAAHPKTSDSVPGGAPVGPLDTEGEKEEDKAVKTGLRLSNPELAKTGRWVDPDVEETYIVFDEAGVTTEEVSEAVAAYYAGLPGFVVLGGKE